LGRFPGKDRAVAQALSRDFGRDESWGMQVVGAAPIVLIDGLNEAQGDAVHSALSEVEAAGCRFELQTGADAGLAKISWPGPPRVRGRLITEMGIAPVAPAPLPGMGSTSTLIVACPYTGQPMKMTITVRAERMAGTPQAAPTQISIPVPAPTVISLPVPVRRSTPSGIQNPAYQPVKTPVHTPLPPRLSNPVAGRPAQTFAKATPGPKSGEPIIIGLDSLDDLQAQPLPDVPVLRASPPRTIVPPQGGVQPMAPNTTPLPDNLMSTPMDLSAFEAGVEGSGIMKAYTSAPAPGVLPPEEEAPPLEDDGSLCSVTMGKNGNPRVHELLAEMTGISVDEAARLCQKPIITLAKDISVPDAEAIKQQFATVRVSVRVTKRK